MEKYYMISEIELRELLADSLKLCALDLSGVDNWEWYGENFQRFIKDVLDSYEIDDDTIQDFSNLAEVILPYDYREAK